MTLDKQIIQVMQNRLEQELAVLEIELTDIGKLDTLNTDDWHGTTGALKTGTADKQILADRVEESLTNDGIVTNLEERYVNVKKALARIIDGTYGICSVGGDDIPLERLEANPAASTCVTHEE